MFCIGVVQSVEVRTKNLRFLPNILAIVEKLMILHLILGLFPILVEKCVRKICSQNVDINVWFSVIQVSVSKEVFCLVLSSFHFLQRYIYKKKIGDRVFVKITTNMRLTTLFKGIFWNNDKLAKFLHNFKISFSNLQFFKNHHQSCYLGIILDIAIFWEIELT